MPDMDDLTKKYVQRINQNLSPDREHPQLETRQYQDFKAQYLPKQLTYYERACNWSAKILKVAPDPKQRPKIEEAIRICHLETTPEGIASFAFLAPVIIIMIIAAIGFLIPIGISAAMGSQDPTTAGSMFVLMFGIIAGISMIVPLQRLPFFLANNWRMKASNQMVLCTFYIVTYMRHTSNLELAVDFAGEHLAPPLSIDMKKVIWDIETEKYESIKESLDTYLDTWKEWNPEFIESMHLIQGSLLEGDKSRRVEMLDKSLAVMLDETYEKMLHYAHNLKSPLTTLHMLGVILPILGLVILPLMVSFMEGVTWYHMAIVYNVALPILVYIIAKQILSTRPTGYGSADITETNPELKRYQDIRIPIGKDEIHISPIFLSVIILVVMLTIAILPFIYHIASPDSDWIYDNSNGFHEVNIHDQDAMKTARFYFLDYRLVNNQAPYDPVTNPYSNGPYGMIAVLFSLLLPLALGVSIGVYYSIRSKDIMKIREETRKLEQEFASALFQLGNRLADGLPAEIAFGKVSEVLEGTPTGKFFDTVTINISKLGMSVEEAIFDEKQGAILAYPSNVIESSMKVLVESSKKGPIVASQAIINVSEYIKQMHRVDERLRDLLSDVISSMKSQVNFLTPVIAGIVVGITTMISGILGTISGKLSLLKGSIDTPLTAFDMFKGGISTYYFQAIVGLYVVQITIILTIMVNGIENGVDETAKGDSLGKNALRATLIYVTIAAITIILFSFIASNISTI